MDAIERVMDHLPRLNLTNESQNEPGLGSEDNDIGQIGAKESQFFENALDLSQGELTPMNSVEYDFGDAICAKVCANHLETRKALQSLEDPLPEKHLPDGFDVEFDAVSNTNKVRPEQLATTYHQVAGPSNGAYSSLLDAIGHQYAPLFSAHNPTALFRDTFLPSQTQEVGDDLFNVGQDPVKEDNNLISDYDEGLE